jgi:hypothetical protein
MSQYAFDPLSIPYFLAFVVSLGIFLLLLYKKGRDPKVQLYLVFQGGIAVLGLSAAMATMSRDVDVWNVWNNLTMVSTTVAIAAIYHFSHVSYTGNAPLEDRRVLLAYIYPLSFILLVLIDPAHEIAVSPDTDLGVYGKEYVGSLWWMKGFYYLTIIIGAVASLHNFFRMYRVKEDLVQKRQALYFILSLLIPLIGFVISVVFVEFLSVFLNVQLGIFLMAVSGGIIAFGILRYHMFDIEFIVRKTFYYSLIALPLIGLFRLIELGISYAVSFTFFEGSIMARLIAAGVVAACFFPMRKLSIKLGDRLLPAFTETVKLDTDKEANVYRRQLEIALADGELSDKEEAMLELLRKDLGITVKGHEMLVEEILSSRDDA